MHSTPRAHAGTAPSAGSPSTASVKDGHACSFDGCTATYRYAYELKRHLRGHTNERPFACDVCGDTFKRASHRNQHQLKHTEVMPHKCDNCGRQFTQNYGLLRHKRETHGIDTRRIHRCTECEDEFESAAQLREHSEAQHGPRKYQCDACPMWYKRPQELNDHKKRAHSTEKPFKCSQCPAEYALARDLRQHLKKCRGAESRHQELGDYEANETAEEMDWSAEHDTDLEEIFFSAADDSLITAPPPATYVGLQPYHRATTSEEDGGFDAPTNELSIDIDGPNYDCNNNASIDRNQSATSLPPNQRHRSGRSSSLSCYLEDDMLEEASSNSETDDFIEVQLTSAPMEAEALTEICVLFESVLNVRAPATPTPAGAPPATPAEVLGDIFACLPRLCVVSASLTSRRFSVVPGRVASLHHVESFRLEQASPKSARLAVQWVTGAERPQGLPISYPNIQSAVADLTNKRWMCRCFVQKLEFLVIPTEDARYSIADQQWRLFGESLQETHIAEWTLQGVNLSTVGKFGDIGAPFRLAASLESVRIRHSPSLRPVDYASVSKACSNGNVRSLHLQPLAGHSSSYELMVEQMMNALSGSALANVVLISAKMPTRFLECLLKMSGERRRLPSITIQHSTTARMYFNHLSKHFAEYVRAETGECRIPLTALGCVGTEQYVTFRTDGVRAKTITFFPCIRSSVLDVPACLYCFS